MPDQQSGSEFWRGLRGQISAFRPRSPEAYVADADEDEKRYYVPFTETVGGQVRCGCAQAGPGGQRADGARGAGLVNRHYHPQQVFAYTISLSGQMNCWSTDWVAVGRGLRCRGARASGAHAEWPTSTRTRCG